MVQVGVDVVNTDGVDAENLHEGSIAHASISVGQRVLAIFRLVTSAATGLVANTNDLELVTRVGVVEFVALDLEGLDGHDGGGGEGRESRLDLERSIKLAACPGQRKEAVKRVSSDSRRGKQCAPPRTWLTSQPRATLTYKHDGSTSILSNVGFGE